MSAGWFVTPPYFLTLGFLAGVVGFRMGWRTGSRVALPLLQGGLGWGAFALAWEFLSPGWAAATAGAWAVGTTLVSIYVFSGRPKETDARVLRAKEYRGQMLEWLSSGRGPEAAPGRTALSHLRELIWYLAAAVATANLASMILGAVLLNYMNAYVATLLRAARRISTVLLLGWNVWSLVRVAAYIALGAAAAAPVFAWSGRTPGGDAARRLAVAGAVGVALDLVLKLALSRPAGRRLAAAVDLEAARESRSSSADLTLDLS